MANCLNSTTNQPYCRDAIWDDYPIYTKIHFTIEWLYSIIPKLHHVKDHYDRKSNQVLTILEQLNVDCVQCVVLLDPHPEPHMLQFHPLDNMGYTHFWIAQQVITWELQVTFWMPHVEPTLIISEKLNWWLSPQYNHPLATPNYCCDKFIHSECKALIKFTHKWLPLQDCYHIQSTSVDHICSSCQWSPELLSICYPAHISTASHLDQFTSDYPDTLHKTQH